MEDIPGLTMCKEPLLGGVPSFYAVILRSFAYVNRLNVSANTGQQWNIWGTEAYPGMTASMIAYGFVEIADLLIEIGLLNHRKIQCTLQQCGFKENVFLLCVALQNKFRLSLGCIPSKKQFPVHLGEGSKKLLQVEHNRMINYTVWELALGTHLKLIDVWRSYKFMLKKCKILKFFEVNFKILHQILAILALISKIRKDKNLTKCLWCGEVANINHLFLKCPVSTLVYDLVNSRCNLDLTLSQRIFGIAQNTNLILWVANFAIYKAYLQGCEGIVVEPKIVFE